MVERANGLGGWIYRCPNCGSTRHHTTGELRLSTGELIRPSPEQILIVKFRNLLDAPNTSERPLTWRRDLEAILAEYDDEQDVEIR